MNLSQLLKLAKAADFDSTLLDNHRGTVDVKLREQLNDTNMMLSSLKNAGSDDKEFMESLEKERLQIIEAIAVYDVKKRKILTDDAQNDRDDFYAGERGCSCHLSPPCGTCTHAGNPQNQIEDESCWTEAVL